MTPIQPTTTISIDDTSYDVASLTPELQQMIQWMDDWRQIEADTVSKLLMVRGALRDLQNTLFRALQQPTPDAPSDQPPAE